jgi:hypothetical protein
MEEERAMKTNRHRVLGVGTFLACTALSFGCDSLADNLLGGGGGGGGGGDGNGGGGGDGTSSGPVVVNGLQTRGGGLGAAGTPVACTKGKSYVGFASTVLEADRIDAPLGTDRMRIKPYSALTGEYPRVIGSTPNLLGTAGATFGQAPDRWYTEPRGGAVSVYTAYRIGFEGCLTYTATAPDYAAAPTTATATTACTALEQTFWNRSPNPTEIASCVTTAMNGTATETDPRRRWAYTCASVLSAAGFLAY